MAGLESQINTAEGIVALGGDTALVLGDGTRAGVLRAGPIIADGARWLTTMAVTAHLSSLRSSARASGTAWGKQAIPAIDERTTDCCLRVAGQVVGFDKKFKLTGTPRYADEMDWSPFHGYCRTSVAMVPLAQADDDLTGRLQGDARQELGARDEAREKALGIMERLGKLGAVPDGRRRGEDTAEVKRLRRALIKAKTRAQYSGEGA